MSRFATRFKHRQHTENITDDDEFPIHLFNYPWPNLHEETQRKHCRYSLSAIGSVKICRFIKFRVRMFARSTFVLFSCFSIHVRM